MPRNRLFPAFPTPAPRFFLLIPALLLIAGPLRSQEKDQVLAHAEKLLHSSLLWDGHNDLPWEIRMQKDHPMDVEAYDLTTRTSGQTDLPRMRQGGVNAQWWSVYIPGEYPDSGYARMQLEEIDIARQFIAKYPDLQLARSADDVMRAYKAGKIASLLGMEGGHAIENSLGALRAYYDLGARYMTLTHNVTLDWADAALDSARHGGLTPFGKEVVREMNRLGMVVDLSHVSPGTMSDALDVSEAPVMFSHSSARALVDVPRNVPDSILRRVKTNGGIVMVTFVGSFISNAMNDSIEVWRPQFQAALATAASDSDSVRVRREFMRTHQMPRATVADVADHVEHVRDVAGVDHVGLGGDYDGTSGLPVGMEDVSGFPRLFAELIRRGWSDADLKKLAGLNMLRVLREVEAVSHRLRQERGPSTKTIQQLDSSSAATSTQ